MLRWGRGRRPHGPRILVAAGSNPPFFCAYPWNATLAELLALNLPGITPFTGKLTIGAGGQDGSLALQAGVAAVKAAGAPTGIVTTAATLDFSANSGVKGLQMAITAPALTGAAGKTVEVTQLIGKKDLSFYLQLTAGVSDLGTRLIGLTRVISGTPVTLFSEATVATGLTTASLQFDTAAGTMKFWVNGVAKTLVSNTFTPGLYVDFGYIAVDASIAAVDAGKVFDTGVVTNAGSMTAPPFDAGTRDTCGNVIV